MKNTDEFVKNLYITDEYIIKNPSLHEEDSPWKTSKIIPLIDKFTECLSKEEINLLDVGGGSGSILNAISTYIEESHGIQVNKFALDLSPGMLEIQKERNPNLKKALNEDLRKTSLSDKQIDITLMIDVLEHVPNPTEALEEVKRISKFAILKVPLEDNLLDRTLNFIKGGRPRQHLIETVGHINVYNFDKLKYQIEQHAGYVLDSYYTNVFDYVHNSGHYKNEMSNVGKLMNFVAGHVFRLSPKLSSLVFTDFVMILVKCY